MTDTRVWAWLQPAALPGFSTGNQDNLGSGLNGTVISTAGYTEFFLRDLNGDGQVRDADTDDGSTTDAGEGLVFDGTVYRPWEIALYTGSTVTVNGVDYTVPLVVILSETGSWGVRILDGNFPPGAYPADFDSARLGTFNGTEYFAVNTTSVDEMLCFAPEVPIRTPDGWRPAGHLRAGDHIMLPEKRAAPLLWVGRQTGSAMRPRDAPVVISKGVLGARQDIRLSPRHCVLIEAPEAMLLFGAPKVLVAAHSLLPLPGVYQTPRRTMTYVHLMPPRHTVLETPGLWCESFRPGPWALERMSREDRLRLARVLPDPSAIRPAFPILKAYETRVLLDAMGLTRSPLLANAHP